MNVNRSIRVVLFMNMTMCVCGYGECNSECACERRLPCEVHCEYGARCEREHERESGARL